jgi:hypothetical protein
MPDRSIARVRYEIAHTQSLARDTKRTENGGLGRSRKTARNYQRLTASSIHGIRKKLWGFFARIAFSEKEGRQGDSSFA